MKLSIQAFYFLICMLLGAQAIRAADWDVTQAVNVLGSNPQLTQSDADGSSQALNGVRLIDDDLVNSTQSANLSGSTVTLRQTGASAAGNRQSINLASAENIDTLNQSVSGFSNLAVINDATTATNNVQAANVAISAGDISNLTQTVTGGDVNLVSNSVNTVQSVNFAEANTYQGTLQQSAILNNVTYSNAGGTGVRINSITGDVSGVTNSPIQTTSIGTVTVVGSGTIVINHLQN